MEDRRIKIKDLNVHITCKLCNGYFVDATAITECLHTFCKSCLIKHLDTETTCPTCNIVIHHSYPRQYINYDRTMQDIVYKLVPRLQADESRREQQFYQSRGLPYPASSAITNSDDEALLLHTKTTKDTSPPLCVTSIRDELINVKLECHGVLEKTVFVRVATRTTVLLVKKFVALRVFRTPHRYLAVQVCCNGASLDCRDTLKYVFLMKWRFQAESPPLTLLCRLD